MQYNKHYTLRRSDIYSIQIACCLLVFFPTHILLSRKPEGLYCVDIFQDIKRSKTPGESGQEIERNFYFLSAV